MSKRITLALAFLAATLVIPAAALGYTPQPHTFALQSSIAPYQACVVPGQPATFSITETNISKTAVVAKVSTNPMGSQPYQFSFVSAVPAAFPTVTAYTDYQGVAQAYTVFSWSKRLKPGQSTTFKIVARAPDWNIPAPPYTYTDPTGQVVTATPPPPQPYPSTFGFMVESIGDLGAVQYISLQLTYCGLEVPSVYGGK